MNKSSRTTKWLFIVFSLIGMIDSLYLIWIKISNDKAYCLPGVGDCWTVNTSRYSQVFGIPISVFGALGYLLILALFLLEIRSVISAANSVVILFGLTFAGFLFSLYLTYLELFVIFAICPFCVLSAISMTILFVISVYRLVKSQAES